MQKQIKFAVIDTDNAYYKSRYASLGSVVDACKEALNSNGIVFIQGASSNKDLPKYTELLVTISSNFSTKTEDGYSVSLKTPKGNVFAETDSEGA